MRLHNMTVAAAVPTAITAAVTPTAIIILVFFSMCKKLLCMLSGNENSFTNNILYHITGKFSIGYSKKSAQIVK